MPFTFRAAPRISREQWTRVLLRHHSPVARMAAECYAIVTSSGLDPAVALAFFGHESTFGTAGVAVHTLNWGNVRTAFNPARVVGHDPANFVIFFSWQAGLRDWCERINERYINQRNLTTPEEAIPIYAPATDGNDTQRYIEHVNALITAWIAEDAATIAGTTPPAAPANDSTLPTAGTAPSDEQPAPGFGAGLPPDEASGNDGTASGSF